MIQHYTQEIQKYTETILRHVPKNSSSSTHIFLKAFFAHAPLQELTSLPVKDALSLAFSAEKFLQIRSIGKAKIQCEPMTLDNGRKVITLLALNDDKPFLVDSLSCLLHRLGLQISHTLHPIFAVNRDNKGLLIECSTNDDAHADCPRESLIMVVLEPLPARLTPKMVEAHVERVLDKVHVSVRDWKIMTRSVEDLAREFERSISGLPRNLSEEISAFLSWLASKNFVFLGYGQYDVTTQKNSVSLKKNIKNSYGLYSLSSTKTNDNTPASIEYSTLPTTSHAIEITKSSDPCEVHRAVPMDLISIRRYDNKGAMIGEVRLLGLFTSNVYYQTTDSIPLIRRKVARTIDKSGFDPVSHNGKSLKAVLEFMPRDELFQLSEDALFSLGMGIQSLESRPKVRLFSRVDNFERYVSCIVYIPRERFSTSIREQMENILSRAYQGKVITFYTQVSDSPLARVNILIATTPSLVPTPDLEQVEAELTLLTISWRDRLLEAYMRSLPQAKAERYLPLYSEAFPAAYCDAYSPESAVSDSERLEDARAGDGLALEFYRHDRQSDNVHLKCYMTDINSTLSDIVPLLENIGTKIINEHPYLISPMGADPILIRDFILKFPGASSYDIAAHKKRFESTLSEIWRGKCNNDALNGLLLTTTLNARDIDILRTFSRYMRQINFAYGQAFIAKALLAHPTIAQQLAELFDTKFNPHIKGREARLATQTTALLQALESITNLAEDKVLRRIMELIDAAIRTNAYQKDNAGNAKSYISIKFLCAKIPELPLPKPMAEIFVYSMRTEGIHLRGDKVARGGLRWSDRPEDFRTEVLGLVKAQMVKNVVIVPQGSKGGFIVKNPQAERDAQMKEGIECYKEFLRGLLDITDNIKDATIVAPKDTLRYDHDDPYLVVAADKGTASFSDIANSVSSEYDFWLSDAFASGGSVGYDHKAMAITARGGWVSVMRHFREMGHDIARESFTCIGIGDMSGDVFGNGMLLSQTMKLVAAFNHRHIFIDPTPDAKKSFKERERLFKLARSGWNDYDAKLISAGGGIFDRNAKSIPLSKEMQTMLGVSIKSASPDDLIALILKAPVDLLWNGGIGTYVKAQRESHDEVGDRANNALRVNGSDLRCKIVGEGGNLGFTQRGRIEYARSGGRINTDAIDNSAGVDCSDHEVNIKIALGSAMQAKRLSLSTRNNLLKSMTDDVAQLVLEDNRLQTQALSLAEAQGASLNDPLERFMQELEKQGLLNRTVEYLPSDKQLIEMKAQGQGFTRPELSVLLAYGKMALYRDIVAHAGLDDTLLLRDLFDYFPAAMHKTFKTDILEHRLRREILATIFANQIVNRMGITFIHDTINHTGAQACDIVDAYNFTRIAFGIDALWTGVESLDATLPSAMQSQLFFILQDFISDNVRWQLSHLPRPIKLSSRIAQQQKPIQHLRTAWKTIADARTIQRAQALQAEWQNAGVPKSLAEDLAALGILRAACVIIAACEGSKSAIDKVAAIYFALGNALEFPAIMQQLRSLPNITEWQRQAASSAESQLAQAQQDLLSNILRDYGAKQTSAALWLQNKDAEFKRYKRFLIHFLAQETMDASKLVVLLREVALLVK